jgi:hypothetical protein
MPASTPAMPAAIPTRPIEAFRRPYQPPVCQQVCLRQQARAYRHTISSPTALVFLLVALLLPVALL